MRSGALRQVAVELDGYRWHRDRLPAGCSTADARFACASCGWLPVRYSAAQIFDTPLAVVADVASVLADRRS